MRVSLAYICAGYLVLITFLAVGAPLLAPAGPFHTSSGVLLGPSASLPMGSDDLGRNVAVEVVYGARTSLLVAVSVAGLAGLIALLVGALAGFVGGAVDDTLMRTAEFAWVMPRFFLAIATAALFGGRIAALVVLLGLVSWPGPARVLRAAVLGQSRLPYVEAARAAGASSIRILARHVLPNSLGPFIVSTTLLAGSAILIETSLSFLGLSDAASPSWGSMLRDAQPIMVRAPWAVAFPALAVTLAVLSFNLIGDSLIDALSPWSLRAQSPDRTANRDRRAAGQSTIRQ